MGGAGVTGERRAPFEETYQLGKELGHGSFSTVREGVHKVRTLFGLAYRPTSVVTKLSLITSMNISQQCSRCRVLYALFDELLSVACRHRPSSCRLCSSSVSTVPLKSLVKTACTIARHIPLRSTFKQGWAQFRWPAR